ncbi:PR5-like receptor kinase [Quercus suber]|uniref:PR5-like receptor kinase n=1 Tax=Quercus suber TaxID=58331 RepID=UPI0032DE67F8
MTLKHRRKHLSSNAIACWKKHARKDQDAEEIIKNYGSLAPKRYTYSYVKKLTNSFKDKIGQGGYGAVYKGKLPNGHIVAVKVLTKSKGNGEEFINEVASISRTSHVNIVTLLGFCHEGTKRALIYEFMPKGSLDKYIYSQGLPDINCHLEWNTIHQIAIGIARGLEYLHRGCSTRILHFDIKPHNILLDEDFCPKISDFGLAKLCQRKESIVSMTGVRGTVGYMAPEVFSRNFGGVSHKSDVYSYGMLVFEMVGGRKNFDAGVSHTSEIYFPYWIYKKLELKENVSICEEMSEQEEETTKKMMIVSLWCIQTNPLDRPSMGKVIEMLESTLQSLEFPPMPFLDSPRRSPQDSSKM